MKIAVLDRNIVGHTVFDRNSLNIAVLDRNIVGHGSIG